ncbi:fimbrial protein [Rahnella contaminans]|uniref:fimbrial protein n=1 Tax=Rahnella contaminans TaxID=2703882 RepID=UPI003C2FF41A
MKIKSPLVIMLLLFLVHSSQVFAEEVTDKLSCNTLAMVTITGTVNAYVSQDSTDLISEGNYIITHPLTSRDMKCVASDADTDEHELYYSLDLGGGIFKPGSSASGQYALLPNTDNSEKLAFMVGYESSDGGRNYVTDDRLNLKLDQIDQKTYIADSTIILSIVSGQGATSALPGTYHYSGTLGMLESYDKTTNTYMQNQGKVNINLTVNLKATSCLVTTDKTIDIRWDALTSKDIINNVADEKVATIGVTCNNSQTPVKISAASANGYVDATGGIVKTSRDNLGLKLTWEDTAQPVNFTAPRTDTLIGTKNYNIVAKPVRYNDGAIALGDFANTVTVSFEYR